MCKENVGCQDQVLAANGGFNHIEFGGSSHLKTTRITIADSKIRFLQDHLMLFFTGFSRMASEIAKHQIDNIASKKKDLTEMYNMTTTALDILNGENLLDLGGLLGESWKIKRQLSDKVSTPYIDDIYNKAKSAGSLGGKLLGAGGGGFVLLFVEPDKQKQVRQALNPLLEIPFKFETQGTQIIFYQPNTGKVE